MEGLNSKVTLGTHGLNEEFGRNKGRNGMTGCILCGDECESVVHVGSVLFTRLVGKSLWLSSRPH